MWRHVQFLGSFAFRDLWEYHARRTSLVATLTISVVTAFVLIIFGLAWGFDASRKRQLKEDPLALCLWTGSPVVRDEITLGVLQRLQECIRNALANDEDLVGCFPYHEVEFEWEVHSGDGNVRTTRLRGRTLAPGDPLLKSRPTNEGKVLQLEEKSPGVVIGPQMLAALAYDQSRIPPELILRTPAGYSVPIRVLGRTQVPLPQNHFFLFSEHTAAALLRYEPEKRSRVVVTGPLSADWTVSELTAKAGDRFQNLLSELGLNRRPTSVEVDGQWRWILRVSSLAGRDMSLVEWQQSVRRIGETLSNLGFPPGARFLEVRLDAPDSQVADSTEEGSAKAYDLVAVYVRDLVHLQPALRAIRSLGLPVESDVVAQVTSIGRTTSLILSVLSAIAVVVAVVAAWNMYTILVLRTEQKIAEIGMMKAMGMCSSQLAGLYIMEGGILWLFGVALGLMIAKVGGVLIAVLWSRLAAGTIPLKFVCPWWLWLGVVVVSLIACVAMSVLATSRARAAEPCTGLAGA